MLPSPLPRRHCAAAGGRSSLAASCLPSSLFSSIAAARGHGRAKPGRCRRLRGLLVFALGRGWGGDPLPGLGVARRRVLRHGDEHWCGGAWWA